MEDYRASQAPQKQEKGARAARFTPRNLPYPVRIIRACYGDSRFGATHKPPQQARIQEADFPDSEGASTSRGDIPESTPCDCGLSARTARLESDCAPSDRRNATRAMLLPSIPTHPGHLSSFTPRNLPYPVRIQPTFLCLQPPALRSSPSRCACRTGCATADVPAVEAPSLANKLQVSKSTITAVALGGRFFSLKHPYQVDCRAVRKE